MDTDRRHLLAWTAAATALASASSAAAAPAAAPVSALGIDAAQFGLRPGSGDDQSRALQRAVDETARTRSPLAIAPGTYQVGGVKLAPGTQIIGVRGATQLMLSESRPLFSAAAADHVGLSGLVLDGGKRPLPERTGLVQLENCHSARIANCEILGSGRNGIMCIAVDGEIADCRLTNIADAAIHSLDGRGLLIARNTLYDVGNNGIQVWRSAAGDDGTIVIDNNIEAIDNRAGGSGQYGNAINVFRAGNVIVRGNRIKNCAYTAVRGNSASNIQIEGNSIADVREVALYAEFGFEGAVIANNTVDGAAIGVSVTNFNEGGRLAVVQGNLIRNLLAQAAAGRRSERRRRHRHLGRGRHRRHRQCRRGRAHRRHDAGLRPVSARCRGDRQYRAQGRYRHRSLGRGRRRQRAHRQQRHRRYPTRRHHRDRPPPDRHRRSDEGRRRALRPPLHQRQPRALTLVH